MQHRSYAAVAIVVLSCAAIAYWPRFIAHATLERTARFVATAAPPTAAPVTRDYMLRPRLIAFWEGAARQRLPGDFMSPRQLGEQYLERYRERGDIDDVLRAVACAKASLRAQPRNSGATILLAAAYLTLHRFHDALALTKELEGAMPGNPDMRIREASLDLEIGRYDDAARIITRLPHVAFPVAELTLRARYDELTHHLARARAELARATALENREFAESAVSRAWFFFREGELAFEAGDNDAAMNDEARAIETFPNYADAYRAKARFECARKRWTSCRRDAQTSAAIVPYPETLGYEADAERGLGERSAARATDDLIDTVARIGNAQHISDRLLAIYYSEHRRRVAEAYRIARAELASRNDIITEDTLAWAAAMSGRWNEARIADRQAMRFGTEISLFHYHAGVIAAHFGDRSTAKREFERALALNSSFHAVYADDARRRLAVPVARR